MHKNCYQSFKQLFCLLGVLIIAVIAMHWVFMYVECTKCSDVLLAQLIALLVLPWLLQVRFEVFWNMYYHYLHYLANNIKFAHYSENGGIVFRVTVWLLTHHSHCWHWIAPENIVRFCLFFKAWKTLFLLTFSSSNCSHTFFFFFFFTLMTKIESLYVLTKMQTNETLPSKILFRPC
jgi:hypothetical protein